jgi:hypothetical protein
MSENEETGQLREEEPEHPSLLEDLPVPDEAAGKVKGGTAPPERDGGKNIPLADPGII